MTNSLPRFDRWKAFFRRAAISALAASSVSSAGAQTPERFKAQAVVSINTDYKFFNWFQIELGEPFAGITLSATGEPTSNGLTIFGITLDDPVNFDQGTYCTISIALGQANIQHVDFDIGGQARRAIPLGPVALQLMKDYAAAVNMKYHSVH